MLFTIVRCAMDHPYQTIPIVYAVANTNIDHKFMQCGEPPEEEVFYTQLSHYSLSIIFVLICSLEY